ncbi:aconitate hydratase AcnA [Streptomyces sp. TS71-3]|uniref:aconitate hydratase AcnA n=1 Tax=Streptomyces sp. TS71-3 TaxID=2733862 RepID=UPI001B1147E2|nr:aconitate hydratase AcnA [Streptomyces sp. TS71-3]GHJ39326.1 aconitate hydratase [Streptomyces sp. TS71-3]
MQTAGPLNSYQSLARLDLAGQSFRVHRLDAIPGAGLLPMSLKILLENLLRHEDGSAVTADQIAALVGGSGDGTGDTREAVSFSPARILLHDTNGVPVLTDLAALRDAVAAAGGDPRRVSPRIPSHLTVDHSIATEVSGRPDALRINVEAEYARNAERYRFLKWGERLDGVHIVPPGAGIMHQINLEFLAPVVERRDGWAFPDTCAGTDSHTTMVSALGTLAWGVGGVEAEVALLGQPLSMAVPPVVGVELVGDLSPGVTATDLVLTVAQTLRAHGVVGKFVEFTGEAIARLPLAHRATISNMCPEFGATTALFPIDRATLDYLRLTGRTPDHVATVEAYAKEQGLWHDPAHRPRYDEHLRIDLSAVTASLAGPSRPHDRLPLAAVPAGAAAAIADLTARRRGRTEPGAARAEEPGGERGPAGASGAIRDSRVRDAAVGDTSIHESTIRDGAVAIAAITSCTNTSNPHVMIAAGLLARNARARGLTSKPWVKTSLAPGSRAVTEYLGRAGLSEPLDELGFQLAGYGCMTCIGNSGPLLPEVANAVAERDVVVASVLSGNRNFDGRINNDVSMNYLASPPLVVAYALAGSITHDLLTEPLGHDADAHPVYLADLWPTDAEIDREVATHLAAELFTDARSRVFEGDERWAAVPAATGELFDWPEDSTYLRRPPFLDGIAEEAQPPRDVLGARPLLLLGDSVTTDHISPAGRIPATSPAGRHLVSLGVTELNTYASRRGNHDVMVRGGFANPRLRNLLAPEATGAVTPDFTRGGTLVPVHEAARSYAAAGVPLIVVAGQEYGTGSSRDWAAKATALLGVRAVVARSFERIHRANLVQLGVLPLQFADGQSAESLGLEGTETFDILGIEEAVRGVRSPVTVRVSPGESTRAPFEFTVTARLDTPQEAGYYAHGGVLPFVYRQFLRGDLD